MYIEKRDAGAKKSAEQRINSATANNILSPHAKQSKNPTSQPESVAEQPTAVEPTTDQAANSAEKSDKNQSFYALPPSVRKTQQSNSVVSSIFGDDMFSSAPAKSKPKTTKTAASSKPTKTSMTSNFAMDEAFGSTGAAPTSESDIFGFAPKAAEPVKKVVKPIVSSSADEIPQPEPFPVALLDNVKPTTPEHVAHIPEPKPNPVLKPEPKPEPVKVPIRKEEKLPEKKQETEAAPPVKTPVTPDTPIVTPASIESLPSPFAADLFIPPRDGGMGETPKARVMQEKLFFRFVNAYLSQRGMSINAFDPDFLNGVLFIMLVETVSHTPLPDSLTAKCKINPTTREEFHLNFHYAAQHLKDIGKPLPVLPISGLCFRLTQLEYS